MTTLLLLTLCGAAPNYEADAAAALALAKAARDRPVVKVQSVPVAPPAVAVVVTSGHSWTWPGGTVESLRSHLAAEHGYSAVYLAGMNFAELKAVHDREHNRKVAPVVAYAPASACPGGVCPAPQAQYQRRGFFGWR